MSSLVALLAVPLWLLVTLPIIIPMKLFQRLRSIRLRKAKTVRPTPTVCLQESEHLELDPETAQWVELFSDCFAAQHAAEHLERCYNNSLAEYDDPLA